MDFYIYFLLTGTAESFIVRIMLEARLGSPPSNMEYHYELNNALCALVMFVFVGKHFASKADAFRRVYHLYKGAEKVVGIKVKFM